MSKKKKLNIADLLPKEKSFQVSDIMRMFWKLWKLIFFNQRKLETFPFKCPLPEWAPQDSFHSRVSVFVGSQETARTFRVTTEKLALRGGFPECMGLRDSGKFGPRRSEIERVVFIKNPNTLWVSALTFCNPEESSEGGIPGCWERLLCAVIGTARLSPESPSLSLTQHFIWVTHHTFQADRPGSWEPEKTVVTS